MAGRACVSWRHNNSPSSKSTSSVLNGTPSNQRGDSSPIVLKNEMFQRAGRLQFRRKIAARSRHLRSEAYPDRRLAGARRGLWVAHDSANPTGWCIRRQLGSPVKCSLKFVLFEWGRKTKKWLVYIKFGIRTLGHKLWINQPILPGSTGLCRWGRERTKMSDRSGFTKVSECTSRTKESQTQTWKYETNKGSSLFTIEKASRRPLHPCGLSDPFRSRRTSRCYAAFLDTWI